MPLRTLRSRLALLALLAVVPTTTTLVVGARQERALLEEAARADALGVARQVGEIHARAVGETAGVLIGLAQLPSVLAHDTAGCEPVIRAILENSDGAYANIGVARPDGEVFCSAVPLPNPVNIGDRSYFRDAAARRALALGTYQLGRITGRASVNLGYPVVDEVGELRAVVYVALDAERLGKLPLARSLPEGATITLYDREGVALAREPKDASALGHRDAGLAELVSRARSGGVDPAEITRQGDNLVALAPLGGDDAWVAVEVPRSRLFAAADARFRRSILVAVLVAGVTALGAWWAGELLLGRRVRALSDLAGRLAAGDLAARSSLSPGADEVGRLAQALDAMAVGLDASTRRSRQILASAAEGIVTLDRAGHVTYANPAACLLLGGRPDQIEGRDAHAALHGDEGHAAGACPLLRALRPDETLAAADDHFRHADGTAIPVQLVASAIVEGGAVDGAVLFFADQRHRVLLEEQLRQAQKMEVVGRLAGGVAHDFNNLLTAILGYGELFRDRLGPERPARELDEMIKSAHRAAALTRQLLAFSRQEPYSPRVVDPNALVRGTEKLLRRVLGEAVALHLTLDPAVRNVRADAGQLEQVLLNLAVNARDAMARGGRLDVRTRALADGRVAIEVQDDGAGMTEAVRRRIFEPFFTTKATGTGLGLSIVQDVVTRASGTIRVDSAPERGATFVVELPGTSEAPEVVGEPDAAVIAGTETVLLVEDDVAVRTFVRRALEGEGYLVIEAVDGEDAEACADAHVGPIHLVLTDLVMPALDGDALVDRLRLSRPAIVALFMTGYAVPPRPDGRVRRDVLQKPFGAQTLLRRVRKALDGALEQPSDVAVVPQELRSP